jgi:hypothetical protein
MVDISKPDSFQILSIIYLPILYHFRDIGEVRNFEAIRTPTAIIIGFTFNTYTISAD